MQHEPRRLERALGSPKPGQPLAQEGLCDLMIALGIILILIGVLVPSLAPLYFVGIIVLVVGLILAVLGSMGRAVGGRRHYY